MQNFLIAIAAAFLLFAGCKSTPKGVLSEEKMVAVFADIHVAEGRLKTVGIFGDSAKKMAPVLYDQVYKSHQTTREEFIASYQYYQSQPEKFEKLMDKVITEVSKKESGIK